jgi:hypothetical protein
MDREVTMRQHFVPVVSAQRHEVVERWGHHDADRREDDEESDPVES